MLPYNLTITLHLSKSKFNTFIILPNGTISWNKLIGALITCLIISLWSNVDIFKIALVNKNSFTNKKNKLNAPIKQYII